MKRVIVLMMVAALATAVQAGLVTNGDFEATPFDTSWTGAGATLAGGLNGTIQAAAINDSGTLGQDFSANVADFSLDFYFEITSEADDRSLNMLLYQATGLSGPTFNLRMATGGTLQAYNNTGAYGNSTKTWYDLATGFAVGSVYRLHLDAYGWSDAGGVGTASYDLSWSDAGSSDLTNSNLGLEYFQVDPSYTGRDGMESMAFKRGAGDGGYTVDEVSVEVPEPATMVLLGLGSLVTLVRRKK